MNSHHYYEESSYSGYLLCCSYQTVHSNIIQYLNLLLFTSLRTELHQIYGICPPNLGNGTNLIVMRLHLFLFVKSLAGDSTTILIRLNMTDILWGLQLTMSDVSKTDSCLIPLSCPECHLAIVLIVVDLSANSFFFIFCSSYNNGL